jgi:hypothetical protein
MCSSSDGRPPSRVASRVLRPRLAYSALAMSAIVTAASLGMLWPLEHEAYAQAGGEKAGAGGAPAAAGAEKTGAGGGGQESPEKSGAGGGAPAGEKAAEKGGEAKQAAPAETKVVIYVEGPKAGDVKAEIEKSLPAGVTALPDAAPFAEALKKQGLVPLNKTIKGPRERAEAAAKLQAAAQEAGAQAAIIATAPAAKGGKYDIAILIVPSDSPQPLASTNVKTASKGSGRAEAIAGVISPAISGIIPIVAPAPEAPKAEEPKAEEPKAEEPKAEEPKAEEKKPEPAATNNFVRGKYLLEGGIGTQGRSFFYIFPPGFTPQDNVRDYSILAAPHLYVHADIFPFAGPGDSFGNNIGLTAIVGGAVGLRSTLNGGGRAEPDTGVKTNFFHVRVGPKVRFLLGSGDKAPMLTGEVAYTRWAFTFDDDTGTAPSFVYQSIRPGVGLRMPAGPVNLLLDTGFHFVTDSGALTARFPNASVLGLDAQAGVAVPLSEKLEMRFNVNYNRYRGNLKAELDPTAANATPYVAAGSVDQFFGLHVGVAVAP